MELDDLESFKQEIDLKDIVNSVTEIPEYASNLKKMPNK
jgi:hypothetical protein